MILSQRGGERMVKDEAQRRDDPFGRFRVVTEPMGDGREIHYYEWPDEDPAGEEGDPGTPPADPEDSRR
jgi:hypothetical protein